MGSAIITNPYSNKSMDSAILQALSMEPGERRKRMSELRRVVRKYDIASWGRDQRAAFEAAGGDFPNGERPAA